MNIEWLRKQLWARILGSTLLLSIFFYFAQGLIVLVGGTTLGVYLYNRYGDSDKKLQDSIAMVKNRVNKMVYPQPVENYGNYKWWSNLNI